MTNRCKQARRFVVLIVGTSVLVLGVVLLFVPGPGLITIAFGLSILASECVWARQTLKRLRQRVYLLRKLRRPLCSPRDRTSKLRLIQRPYGPRATFHHA
jgi:uncharacterized protein (TIGR02611 family)